MPHGILKMVSVGDLHFGSPRIDASDLYRKLRKYLYPELKDAHLITVDGDIYDQLLMVNSKAYKFATMFIKDLFNLSALTGCQVRLLHGTFSHDRDQISIFESLAQPKTRFKIVNEISVEEIEGFQNGLDTVNCTLRLGYLPDNLSYRNAQDAVDHLKRAMTVCGYGTLDVVVGHGTFLHTVAPGTPHLPAITYTKEMFDDIVRGIIVMGHIHTPSRKYNIYYCGSFERMSHGEEEDKGFYVFTRDQSGKEGWRSRFVVNREATPFLTVTPEGKDIPEIIHNFIEYVNTHFPEKRGFVRVAHSDPEVRTTLHKVCAQQFDAISYSSKALNTDDTEQALKVEDITLDIDDDVKPNKNNLGELIWKFLEEHNNTAEVTREEILSTTNSVISEAYDR